MQLVVITAVELAQKVAKILYHTNYTVETECPSESHLTFDQLSYFYGL